MTIKTFSKLVVLLAAVFVGYTYLFSTSISQIEADITTGLVGHWKMDEASWNGISDEVVDSSGSGNHGTAFGGLSTVSGLVNSGGTFDGINDHIDIPDSSSIDFGTGDFSVSMWAKYPSQVGGSHDYSILFTNSAVGPGFPFTGITMFAGNSASGNSNQLVFRVDANNALISSNSSLDNNSWHHLVGVRESNVLKIYIDGILDSSLSVSPINITTNGDIRIGSNQSSSTSQNLEGDVDEVRMYNRALSQSDVEDLYNFEWPLPCSSDSVSWYNDSWLHRKCFSINHPHISGSSNLANFPVYLDLSDFGAEFFTNVKPDGGDIIITSNNGTTSLVRDVVEINKGAGTGELWFKAPSVSYTEDTVFYLYYGNTAASGVNSSDIWNNGYNRVYYMNEDPSLSAPILTNAVSGAKSGASAGSMTNSDLVSARLGKGVLFDGVDDVIDLGSHTSNDTLYTISVWVKSSGGTSVHRGSSSGGCFYNPQIALGGITETGCSTVGRILTGYSDTGWHLLTAVKSGSSFIAYVDGTQIGTKSIGSPSSTSTGRFVLGAGWNSPVTYSFLLNGIIDHYSEYNGVRSSGWLKSEFNNQSSPTTFFSISDQESTFSINISCPSSVQARFTAGDLGLVQSGTYSQSILDGATYDFTWNVVMNGDAINLENTFGGVITLTEPGGGTTVVSSARALNIPLVPATGTYSIQARATNGDLCDYAQIEVVADPPVCTAASIAGVGITTVSGDTDVTSVAVCGTNDVYVRNTDGDITAKMTVDLNTGRDWRAMAAENKTSAENNGGAGTALLHFPGGASSIPGLVGGSFTLYVPREAGDDYVRICPGAETLSELSGACIGGVNLSVGTTGQYTVTQVTLETRDLWAVAGVTGTGGLGVQEGRTVYIDLDAQPATLPSTISTAPEVAVSTADEFYLSYIPTSTEFGIGDAVDIVIPFDWTGLATCATSTTDADGDATGDGTLAVIDTQIIRFTFTAVTTTALSTGVEFCFAATSSPTVGNYSIAMSDTNDGDFAPALIYVGDDNDVTISATIPITLSLRIKEELTTADTNSCNLGVLNPGSVNSCSYRIAAGTNISTGLQVFVSADNQLNTAGDTSDIGDTAGGGTITAGTEEHGIIVDLGTSWTVGGSFSESTDEPMPLTSTLILDAAAAISDSSEVFWNKVTHSASVNSGTAGGSYDQLVTYRAWVDT